MEKGLLWSCGACRVRAASGTAESSRAFVRGCACSNASLAPATHLRSSRVAPSAPCTLSAMLHPWPCHVTPFATLRTWHARTILSLPSLFFHFSLNLRARIADILGMLENILLTVLEIAVYVLFVGSLVGPFVGVLISEWDR